MRKVALLLPVFFLRAQTPPPADPLLEKIRERMIFNLSHQPNYTCVETIERASRPKDTGKFKIIDTVRLEVGLVDGREMFARPGSKKFEEVEISKLVPRGVIGNGNFGTHAHALFTTNSATFRYVGEQSFQGKRAIRYEYDVPQKLSSYRVKVGGVSSIVSYHGSVYASPNTFDIKRIEVIADRVPVELGLASAADIIDYAITHIGEADFLLPSESEQTMISQYGGEDRNHVTFTSCHQFAAESTLTFGDAPATTPDAAPATTHEFDLPSGLFIELATTQDIDLNTAAVGDPIYACVAQDVKQKGQIIIPKDATATGHISGLEKHPGRMLLTILFRDIEAPGMLAHMKGRLTAIFGIDPRGRVEQPVEGTISLKTTQLQISRGCILTWGT
jgi:hypothetical protein